MPNNFKNDESFLRKLAIGAAGTNTTIEQLKVLGFNPIELERGSTGFKIWKKIKIKRVRVPDILCLNTGLRFESRGKTKLEISMSHSLKDPKRTWDAGMRDDDIVSIVAFKQADESPIDLRQISPIHFISVSEMRSAFAADHISITKPKGVEEGSEIRVIWNSATANQNSVVQSIENEKINLVSIPDTKNQSIKLSRKNGKITLLPQVSIGETVALNQIVASVVPVTTILHPPQSVDENYFIEKLNSISLSERYAAAKALRYRGYITAKPILESRLLDANEDIYVQLEAAAALAAFDYPSGWDFIRNKLHSQPMMVPLATQLETVIVVSELPKSQSEQLLIQILADPHRDDELRAGAAWALGQFATPTAATALVATFNASPLEIKIEAARALSRIAEPQIPHLLELLKEGEPDSRDGLSWVLARTGSFNPLDLITKDDENLRRWLSYIVGYGRSRFLQDDIESICKVDPEIYFAASVLWQVVSSWINEITEY